MKEKDFKVNAGPPTCNGLRKAGYCEGDNRSAQAFNPLYIIPYVAIQIKYESCFKF